MKSEEVGLVLFSLLFAVIAILLLASYQYRTEEYFSQCVKINEETIQCQMPK